MTYYQLRPAGTATPAKRWLQTAVAAVVGTGLLIVSFFFALFALAALALTVAVLAARWWWLLRKARRRTDQANGVVEGEYRVVERERSGAEER